MTSTQSFPILLVLASLLLVAIPVSAVTTTVDTDWGLNQYEAIFRLDAESSWGNLSISDQAEWNLSRQIPEERYGGELIATNDRIYEIGGARPVGSSHLR